MASFVPYVNEENILSNYFGTMTKLVLFQVSSYGRAVYRNENCLCSPSKVVTDSSKAGNPFFNCVLLHLLTSIFSKDFIYLFFREGKGEIKRGRETSVCGCLSRVFPTGDLARIPGMCPAWESELATL